MVRPHTGQQEVSLFFLFDTKSVIKIQINIVYENKVKRLINFSFNNVNCFEVIKIAIGLNSGE